MTTENIQANEDLELNEAVLAELENDEITVDDDATLEADTGFGDLDELSDVLDSAAEEVEADDTEEVEGELDEETLNSLAGATAKAEAYSEQEAEEIDASDSDKPAVEDEAPKKAKAPRKTMAGGKKSDVIRDRLPETLVLEMSDAELEASELESKQDELLEYIDTEMAVKVGEKAVNLLSAAHDGAKLSAYTAITLRLLDKKEDGFTVKELIEHMQDQEANGVKSYSAGTANSQSHQMFKLLPKLKIANVDNKVMTVNDDSLLMIALREVI